MNICYKPGFVPAAEASFDQTQDRLLFRQKYPKPWLPYAAFLACAHAKGKWAGRRVPCVARRILRQNAGQVRRLRNLPYAVISSNSLSFRPVGEIFPPPSSTPDQLGDRTRALETLQVRGPAHRQRSLPLVEMTEWPGFPNSSALLGSVYVAFYKQQISAHETFTQSLVY